MICNYKNGENFDQKTDIFMNINIQIQDFCKHT